MKARMRFERQSPLYAHLLHERTNEIWEAAPTVRLLASWKHEWELSGSPHCTHTCFMKARMRFERQPPLYSCLLPKSTNEIWEAAPTVRMLASWKHEWDLRGSPHCTHTCFMKARMRFERQPPLYAYLLHESTNEIWAAVPTVRTLASWKDEWDLRGSPHCTLTCFMKARMRIERQSALYAHLLHESTNEIWEAAPTVLMLAS